MEDTCCKGDFCNNPSTDRATEGPLIIPGPDPGVLESLDCDLCDGYGSTVEEAEIMCKETSAEAKCNKDHFCYSTHYEISGVNMVIKNCSHGVEKTCDDICKSVGQGSNGCKVRI